MRITILGAGTPTPSAERWGTSFAVEVDNQLAMFDCGPGAMTKLLQSGFEPSDVDWIFFTHHHFDHNVDFPTLLLSRWDQSVGNETELGIVGPYPTEVFTERLVGPDGAFAHDISARINHPASQRVFENRGGTLPRRAPDYRPQELLAGDSIHAPGFTVHSSSAVHVEPYLHSLAYRLETPDGVVTFTGDTEPCDSVRELASGSDLLVCMCCDLQETMNSNGEHMAQCGTTGAGDLAEAAGVGHLLLVHSKAETAESKLRQVALQEVRERFGGEVTFADEMLKLTLETGRISRS